MNLWNLISRWLSWSALILSILTASINGLKGKEHAPDVGRRIPTLWLTMETMVPESEQTALGEGADRQVQLLIESKEIWAQLLIGNHLAGVSESKEAGAVLKEVNDKFHILFKEEVGVGMQAEMEVLYQEVAYEGIAQFKEDQL